MPSFRYRALEASGRRVDGILDAADRRDALRQLQASGRMPVSVHARDGTGLTALLQADLFGERTLSPARLAVFMREFATVLQAGTTVEQALELILDAHKDERIGVLTADILERVRGGASLADAMAGQGRSFPDYVVNMIRMGSESGTLESMTARLADQIETATALRAKIVSGLTYPAMLIVTAVATILLLVTFLVPQFETIFRNAGAELPILTRMVRTASDLMIRHGLTVLVLLGAGSLLLAGLLRDPSRRRAADRLILRLPGLGPFLAKASAAHIVRMLSTLVTSGMPLARAVEVTATTVRNLAFRDALTRALEDLKSGKRLFHGLDKAPIFPAQMRKLVKVGEESGALEPVLERLSALLERDVERAIQRFMALFTPVINLIMGVLVAIIVLAIMLPILNLNTLI